MGRKTEVLTLCRERLESLPGIRKVSTRPPARDTRPPSADLSVVLETDVGRFTYAGVVQRRLTAAALDHWLLGLAGSSRRGDAAKPMLLADYVSPVNAQRLREADVDYVDTAGNVQIHRPPKLHLLNSGARPRPRPESRPGRLFTPSGLQILFTLLVEPAADIPYRDLAVRSGVALGSIAVVMKELRANGYLTRRRSGVRLAGRQELVARWVSGYIEQLRPKLLIGTFTAHERDAGLNWQRLRGVLGERQIEVALTGGLAADELTHHYRGEDLAAFVGSWPNGVLAQLQWLPSEAGRITILRQFGPVVRWSKAREQPLAHPLLVYAELLHSGREREREAARLVRERYLEAFVAHDTD